MAATLDAHLAQSPDSEWPEAWYMTDSEVSDPKARNRRVPNVAAPVSDLKALGILYWKMDEQYQHSYPIKSVPWDPKDTSDPKLAALRDDRGYSYADVITIHRDHLPNFDKMIAAFYATYPRCRRN